MKKTTQLANPEDILGYQHVDSQLVVFQYAGFYLKEGTKKKLHYYWCLCWHEDENEWVFMNEPVDRDKIKSGNTKSCGCRAVRNAKSKHKQLIGSKVLDFAIKDAWSINKGKHARIHVLTTCFCGNEFSTCLDDLKSGHTKSCGCLKKFAEGEASINERMNKVKHSAKQRGFIFELTREEFKNIVMQPCLYCNGEGREYHTNPDLNGKFFGNSIDQLECGFGYTAQNSVSCCDKCNGMKHILSPNAWQDKLKRIEEIDYDNLFFNREFREISEIELKKFRGLYKSKRAQAKADDKQWNLTEQQYYHLANSNCLYCDEPPSNLNKYFSSENYQGVDKVNSDGHYDYENCVPSCKGCNTGKKDCSPSEFIEHLKSLQGYRSSLKKKKAP